MLIRVLSGGQGKKGVMPMRCELRESGRVDLEKAIARMGGFGPTAARLNLCLAYKQRKPRGYWDDLQNIHKEVSPIDAWPILNLHC